MQKQKSKNKILQFLNVVRNTRKIWISWQCWCVLSAVCFGFSLIVFPNNFLCFRRIFHRHHSHSCWFTLPIPSSTKATSPIGKVAMEKLAGFRSSYYEAVYWLMFYAAWMYECCETSSALLSTFLCFIFHFIQSYRFDRWTVENFILKV